MDGTIKKVIFFVILTAILLSALLYYFMAKESGREVIITTTPGNIFSKTTPTPMVISGDFPPLYPGVEWGEPRSVDKIVFRNSDGSLITLSGTYLSSTHEVNYDEEFFKFYLLELKRSGWIENDSAGGPEGELYHFQMGNKYMTVGYKVTKDKPGVEGKVTSYQYYLQYSQ